MSRPFIVLGDTSSHGGNVQSATEEALSPGEFRVVFV